MYVLFTDTDCDITVEGAKKLDYNVISMPYTIDEKDVYPNVDYEVFDSKAFYDILRSGKLPTTSAISEEKYISYFEPYFKEGKDILYVHFSSAMSMTFQNLDRAVATLKEKYPERNFYRIDTKGISVLSLNILYEVSDMYKEGKTPEEILQWANTEVDKFAVYFFADDLKFFKKSGRVSGITATMGNLIGIRPIIYVNDEGKMIQIGKEKGRNKAINRLLSYVKELGDDVKSHRVIIAHTDALENAETLKTKLLEEFGDDLCIEISQVNPTIGSHCGPDCIGVSFHCVHR